MNDSLIAFGRELTRELRSIGKNITADTYGSVLNSFERFLNGGDIRISDIEPELMIAYECHMKSQGLCPNTTSFYMRNLRAVYNRAVAKGLSSQRYPFRPVFTGIERTRKRAVPLEVIRQIRDVDLEADPPMRLARDLFMFSFYTRGMSFVDMAYLRKSDLRAGFLTYRRQKTGHLLHIKWERPMEEIVSRIGVKDSPYLLPIITDMNGDRRRQYRLSEQRVNRRLRKLGEALGIDIPLTTYVARHSWASTAHERDIRLSVISEAMGHNSETTTMIYLSSIDSSRVDNANSEIIALLQ